MVTCIFLTLGKFSTSGMESHPVERKESKSVHDELLKSACNFALFSHPLFVYFLCVLSSL